ncbi:MAG: pirin family protein [Planctomycetota bacterium]|jgi:redox-sensitive bicupin YhaK (pirin superfamily)|nr:pirin family protein [Planctomycetota bacterium]
MAGFLTNVAQTEPFGIVGAATALRFDRDMLKDFAGPVILFDHLRLRAAGFPPHPHAGLGIVTYLPEDSPGALRDRDTASGETRVEPGDLLWFRTGTGLIHEENPAAEGMEVNQVQIWVPLAEKSQALPPATSLLKAAAVPVAGDAGGNRVKVMLGEYGGARSPLETTEPFALLDLALSGRLPLEVPVGWEGIVYASAGEIAVELPGEGAVLGPGQVIGIRPGAALRLRGNGARALYMARPILGRPLVVQGMYAMAGQADIDAAKRRFHAGEFGEIVPYPKIEHPERKYVPAGLEPDLAVTPVVLRQAEVRHYDQGWWKLRLQYVRYEYNNSETAHGYRFVWENPDGEEEPYQLGGYIPYMEYAAELLAIAGREGWGNIPYRDSF